MDKINLRIGNTAFMKNYWNNADTNLRGYNVGLTEIPVNFALDYQKDGPIGALEHGIRVLHDKVGNCETTGRTIVVGAGATQIIHAAIYAMKRRGKTRMSVQMPYYFRFREMAAASGIDFEPHMFGMVERQFELLTYPNNPDNQLREAKLDSVVIDACYNWPQYTDQMVKLDTECAIFSLAKATGHAGTRVGWALVKDKEFAKNMIHYIELASGGVSVDAQMRAYRVIESLTDLREGDTTCFEDGRSVLKFRWKKLLESLPPEIKALNSYGMFLWGEVDSNRHVTDAAQYIENEYGILAMDGALCGGTRQNFRVNVGCDDASFQLMIDRLKGSRG